MENNHKTMRMKTNIKLILPPPPPIKQPIMPLDIVRVTTSFEIAYQSYSAGF